MPKQTANTKSLSNSPNKQMSHISIYHRKTAAAANSPRKRSAMHSFKPTTNNLKKGSDKHPFEKWITSNVNQKLEFIATGNFPAILTIKKDDKLKSFSLLTASNNYTDRFRAQASHDLNKPCPAYLLRADTTKYVVSIMDKDLATQFNFNFLDSDIREGLINEVDPTKAMFHTDKLPDEFPANKATAITNGDANANKIPVLTLVPITAPTGYAKEIPEGRISDPEVLMMLQENHDALLLWAQAINFLLAKNNGKSLHEPNTNAQFGEHIPIADNQRAIWNTALTSDVWTTPLALMPDEEDYDEIQSNVSILANQLFETWQQEDDAARQAWSGNPTTTATGTAAISDFASLLSDANGGNSSYTKETKLKVTTALKLLCTTRSDTTKQYDLPNTLNPNITNVINGGVKAYTPVELNRALTQFHQHLNEDNRNFVTTESRPQLYNKQFWSHLFTTQWNTQNIKTSSDLLDDTTWTPFNVAPTDELADEYRTQRAEIIAEDLQGRAGWDKSKTTQSSVIPTRNFEVNTAEAVCAMMANTALLLLFFKSDMIGTVVKDGEIPIFAEMTETIISLITQPSAREWKKLLNNEYPWAWWAIAKKYSNLMAELMKLAIDPSTNQDAQGNVNPKDNNKSLTKIIKGFSDLGRDIETAVEDCSTGTLTNSTPPPIWTEVCPTRFKLYQAKTRKLNGTDDTNSNNDGRPPHNPRGGRGGGRGPHHQGRGTGRGFNETRNTQREGYTPREVQGIGIFIQVDVNLPLGLGNTKIPRFAFKGKDRELCIRFCTKNGKGCPFGNNCNKFHLTVKAFQHLTKQEKKPVDDLVNGVTNLKYSDGFTVLERSLDTNPTANTTSTPAANTDTAKGKKANTQG
jgi:hypothetical protein